MWTWGQAATDSEISLQEVFESVKIDIKTAENYSDFLYFNFYHKYWIERSRSEIYQYYYFSYCEPQWRDCPYVYLHLVYLVNHLVFIFKVLWPFCSYLWGLDMTMFICMGCPFIELITFYVTMYFEQWKVRKSKHPLLFFHLSRCLHQHHWWFYPHVSHLHCLPPPGQCQADNQHWQSHCPRQTYFPRLRALFSWF